MLEDRASLHQIYKKDDDTVNTPIMKIFNVFLSQTRKRYTANAVHCIYSLNSDFYHIYNETFT